MLPHNYTLPVAVLLVLGGALSCVAGYRLFRIVLGIYGFILGAMLASSMVGVTNTAAMVVAAIVGGLAGALVLVFMYFVGIALIGAGLGALIAHVAWGQAGTAEPPAAVIVAVSILGAIGAMLLQRDVMIVGTAFGGAWTLIVGALAVAGDRGAARAASSGGVWILYPLAAAAGQRWVPVAWVALGMIGTVVQLGVLRKKKK